RRRHTRSKRDWSSDVCSSDLGRVNGDQEVLFIPVLSNSESVGDGIAGNSSNKHDQIGFFKQIVGRFWSTISHRSHIGWRIKRYRSLGAPFNGTSNGVIF